MAKAIQIRNVPEEIHRTLRVRATKDGRSLSEYLLRELEQMAEWPTVAEMLERARRRGPIAGVTSEMVTAMIREERDQR